MNSVVFGNLSVTLTDRHGARLTRLPLRAPAADPVRLPHGPHIAPPPFVVGREEQLALARRAAREQGAVEFTGSCGAGKTTLLKNAAAGGVYVRVGGTEPADLLQDLMRRFYVYPGPDGTRLTTEQCAQALGHVGAVVALDDVSYSPDQLGFLRLVLQGCALVVGSSNPALGALGTSHALPGLSEPAALSLLSRELGRYIPGSELAAVRRLVAAVDGQPLHLRQAAALVRFDGSTFDDLARRAESDPGVLDELSISAVGPQAKRALAVLTLVGGALLPAGLLSQMAEIAYVSETWESLSARGLAEQGEDRFGLPVCKAEPYRRILYRSIGLASAMRSLGAWLASGDPTGEEARGAADAALSLLGVAAEQRQWQAVVQLATTVERVLFVQGHWQAWQNTLAQGITAAQAAGDTVSEAYFTHQQGVQHFLHDRTDHARRLLRRALDLRTQLGDTAGAAVTAANLALLEPAAPPPPPPSPPGAPNSRRRVMTAVAAVVAVLVIGTMVGQALGGSGDKDDSGDSEPPSVSSSDSGGTGGDPTVSGTSGNPTVGGTSSGTTGETTTGETTTGNGGSPETLAAPVITPTSHDFGLVHVEPVEEPSEFGFTVTNPNDQAIDIAPAIPDDSGFWVIGGTCSDQLAAKRDCTVTVELSPTRTDAVSSQLTVTSGDNDATADLSGTGYVHLNVVVTGGDVDDVTITGIPPDAVCDTPDNPLNCEFDVSTEAPKLDASIANAKYEFKGWSGACPTAQNPCIPALDQDGTMTAAFGPPILR